MNNRNILSVVFMLMVFIMPVQSMAEGMTKAQGDAILKELKEISKLLKQNQRAAAPKRAPSGPVKVSAKGDNALGKKDAPLVLVEFSDYQCPYCKRFHDTTFKQIKKNYIDTGKIKYVARDLPLSFHPHAKLAAHAARCAGEQNKFWEMRHALINNSKKVKPEFINKTAKGLSLKMASYKSCMDSNKYQKAIQQDMASASSAGITGTPSFVLAKNTGDIVTGKKIVGARPYNAFEADIKKMLLSIKK